MKNLLYYAGIIFPNYYSQSNYSFALPDKSEMLHYSAMGYLNMGYACLENKDFKSALDYFTRSFELYKKSGLDKDAGEVEMLIKKLKNP